MDDNMNCLLFASFLLYGAYDGVSFGVVLVSTCLFPECFIISNNIGSKSLKVLGRFRCLVILTLFKKNFQFSVEFRR